MGHPFLSYNIHLPIERLVWILFGNLTVPLETNLTAVFSCLYFWSIHSKRFSFQACSLQENKGEADLFKPQK